MIKINGLNKFYNKGKNNEIHVINNVSLNLPDKGLITLFGKSGSGKTTLLNVIGGLDRATGTLTYDDLELKNYNMGKIDKYRREHIGYVFQNYNLLTEKTVWENLEIALQAVDITAKEEVEKRIEYSLKAVGLYKFRKKPAFALSGGQMQRVSIARALVKNSKIIIADEPTGNLDSENSVEIMNILKKISKNSLVLLVTHDKELAEFYSDKIIEISDGKVENIRDTSDSASLSDRLTGNNIYLKDLQSYEGQTDNLKYHIYVDEGELEDLEFTIVKKNNQLYLKSNQKIKLLEDTNLKLIDDHYKEIKKDEVEENFNYDTSWYNDKKSQNFFKRTFENLKLSFKGFFRGRKRTKFFHFAFLLIGAVLAFLNITFATYSKINISDFVYDKDVYSIENYYEMASSNEGYNKLSEAINEAFDENLIDEFLQLTSVYNYRNFYLSSFDTRGLGVYYTELSDKLIEDSEILCGRRSETKSEVVISNVLADQMLKILNYPSATYTSLIGREISGRRSSSTCTIVGIVNKDSKAVYYNDTSESAFSNNYIYDYTNSYYLTGFSKNYAQYEIIDGKDISSNLEGLASEKSIYKVGDKVGNITIVGIYSITNLDINYGYYYDESSLIIVNDSTISYIDNFADSYYSRVYFTSSNITALKNYLSEQGIVVNDSFEIAYLDAVNESNQMKYILVPIMGVLLAVTLVYIYFSMRSKMISDIYSIGVQRALGFSRMRMIGKYICEIFVMTLFTTLLGYLIISVFYELIAIKLSALSFTLVTLFDFYSTYVILIGLLFANIIIGLMPIVTLMNKTPSEIIAKYDI